MMPNPSLSIEKAFTNCEIHYDSLYRLAYDLENNRKRMKDWYVLMDGNRMTIDQFLNWFDNHFNIKVGADFYAKV